MKRKAKRKAKSVVPMEIRARQQGARARRAVAKQARALRQGALGVVASVAVLGASVRAFAQGFWQP